MLCSAMLCGEPQLHKTGMLRRFNSTKGDRALTIGEESCLYLWVKSINKQITVYTRVQTNAKSKEKIVAMIEPMQRP